MRPPTRRDALRLAAGSIAVLAGCSSYGSEATTTTPTRIEDGPAVLVENKLDTSQIVGVEIHEDEEEPPILETRFELGSGEREADPLDLAPGNYVVRAGMEDGPIETLFGDSWSLSGAETMYVEVTRSHIYFEEL